MEPTAAAVGTGCTKWKRHAPICTKARKLTGMEPTRTVPTSTDPTGTEVTRHGANRHGANRHGACLRGSAILVCERLQFGAWN